MDYETLKKQIEKWNSFPILIDEKRRKWESEVKGLLGQTLKGVIDQFSLDAHVQTNDREKNWESVVLAINSKPSGISQVTENQISHRPKIGAALIFALTHNGDVIPVIRFPFIEGVITRRNDLILSKVHPDDVNKEFVIDLVSQFFEAQIDWEEDKRIEVSEDLEPDLEEYPPIGFVLPKNSED